MNSTLLTSALLSTLVAIIVLATPARSSLRRGFLYGISLWCQWLPVLTTMFYMGIIALTLWPLNGFSSVSLARFFSTPELVVMFLVAPMFLTRAGNLIAVATTIYATSAVIAEPGSVHATPGLLILAATLTITAILADRMPWHPHMRFGSTAQKIRDISFVTICALSFGFTAIALLRVQSLGAWIHHLYLFKIPPPKLFLALSVLLLGWLGVILGYARHALLPVLCLPTCVVVSYLTNIPNYLLIIPFAAIVALSLASADHFYNLQRRVRRS